MAQAVAAGEGATIDRVALGGVLDAGVAGDPVVAHDVLVVSLTDGRFDATPGSAYDGVTYPVVDTVFSMVMFLLIRLTRCDVRFCVRRRARRNPPCTGRLFSNGNVFINYVYDVYYSLLSGKRMRRPSSGVLLIMFMMFIYLLSGKRMRRPSSGVASGRRTRSCCDKCRVGLRSYFNTEVHQYVTKTGIDDGGYYTHPVLCTVYYVR